MGTSVLSQSAVRRLSRWLARRFICVHLCPSVANSFGFCRSRFGGGKQFGDAPTLVRRADLGGGWPGASPNCFAAARRKTYTESERGGALLMVLWLVAALTAIAFTLASTVRSETERVSTTVDGMRAQYLAAGAVERGILNVEWSYQFRKQDNQPYYDTGMTRFAMSFPSGVATVEIIPETAKLGVNTAKAEDLMALMAALAIEPGRAHGIVAGILERREPLAPGESATQLSAPGSSFLPRHASFEEIEELLLIKGVTPDIFYGTAVRDAEGHWLRRAGLRDCLSVFGSSTAVDVNGAEPAVLLAVGVLPDMVDRIVRLRMGRPIRSAADLLELGKDQPGLDRLTAGRSLLSTVRATAQVRRPDGTLSDTRRSAAALVKFLDASEAGVPHHILRWYGNVWVQ